MDEQQLETIALFFRHPRRLLRGLADGSAVVVDLDGMELLTLNASASLVVNAILDDVRTVEGLVDRLTGEFEVGREQARKDVEQILNRLHRELPASPRQS